MKWLRSSRCEGGHCVEVALHENLIYVRDSKDSREILCFSKDEWSAFVNGVNHGEFNVKV